MSNANIINGSRAGTGANIDIELGFIPSKVEVTNTVTRTKIEWFSSMADGTGIDRAGAAVANPLGITPIGGAAGAQFMGFRIGTHGVNTAGNNLHWVAYRNGMGSGG